MRTKPLKTTSRKLCREKNQHSSLHDHIDNKKFFNPLSGFGTLLKNSQTSQFHVSLDLAGTCAISWLFINHCEWKLLGFPRLLEDHHDI